MEKYDFGRKIGQGSYATVYLVRHKATGAVYVAKEMSLENISAKEYAAMETEIRLLAKLHHPGIVQYVESFLVGTPAHTIFIIMGYCEGGDLTRFIRNRDGETLSEKEVLHFLVQLLLALEYLHSENIMHRDLKPGNVFISNGYLQLGDLGIAKELTSTSNMALTCIGTPYYMSPELFQNKPYNHKSDVWALGCLIYETACFRRPFEANTITSLAQKVTAGVFSPLASSFSRNMRLLVKKLLALTPTARPELRDLLLAGFIRQRVLTYTKSLVADAALFSPAALATLRTQLLRLGLTEAATLIPIDPSSRPSSAQPARPVPFATVRHHALVALEDGDGATAASLAPLLPSRAMSPGDVARESADSGSSRSLPLPHPEPAGPPHLRVLLEPSRGGQVLVASAADAVCAVQPVATAVAHNLHRPHCSGASISSSTPRAAPLHPPPGAQTPTLVLADVASDTPRHTPPRQHSQLSYLSRAPTPARDTSINTADLAPRTPHHPHARPISPMPYAASPGAPVGAVPATLLAHVPRGSSPRSVHRHRPPSPSTLLSLRGPHAQAPETAVSVSAEPPRAPASASAPPPAAHTTPATHTTLASGTTPASAPAASCAAARTPHVLGGLAVDEYAYLPLAAPARARYCPSYTHERLERDTPPTRQSTVRVASAGASENHAPVAALAVSDRVARVAAVGSCSSHSSHAAPAAACALTAPCVGYALPPVEPLEAGARACLALLKQRHGGASVPAAPDAPAQVLAAQPSPLEYHPPPLFDSTLLPRVVDYQTTGTTVLSPDLAPTTPPDLATGACAAMVPQGAMVPLPSAVTPPLVSALAVAALSPFDRDKLRAVRRRASTAAAAAAAGSVCVASAGGGVGGVDLMPEPHMAVDDPEPEHVTVNTPLLPSLISLTRLDRARPRVGCEAASSASAALLPSAAATTATTATATAMATASPSVPAPPAGSTSFSSAFQAALTAQTPTPASVACVSDPRIPYQYPAPVSPLRGGVISAASVDSGALPRVSSATRKHSSQLPVLPVLPVLPADPQLQPLAPSAGHAATPGADLWAAQLQRAARVLPRESLREAYALLYARHTRAEAQLSDGELHTRLHALLGVHAEELLPLLHDIVFSACSQGL